MVYRKELVVTRADFNIRLILVFGVVFLAVIVLTIWALKGGKDFNWIKRHFLFFKTMILCLSILVNFAIASISHQVLQTKR